MTLRVDTTRLKWFGDSPDAGPECTCSLCGHPILEPELPLRLFDTDKNQEARLHMKCWNAVSPDTIYAAEEEVANDPTPRL